jgi:RNA polymerase sigma-70 factor, ECF subfamily
MLALLSGATPSQWRPPFKTVVRTVLGALPEEPGEEEGPVGRSKVSGVVAMRAWPGEEGFAARRVVEVEGGAAVTADETELLKQVRRGDPAAMEALLSRYEKDVYRFGLRMCGSEEAAREVLQQTLLAAFQNLKRFRGDAKISTWLYQIARSFCTKSHRPGSEATVPLESPEAMSVPAGEATPEEGARARELGLALSAAIQALPISQREVLILRDVEGLSAEEAAAVLGIQVANLKTRLHRARAELRKHLADLLEPAGAPCENLPHDLMDFVSEDIDQAACEKIEEHLASCPKCAGACDALKRTVSLCRSIPGDEVPAPVRAAVRSALRITGPRTSLG